MEDFLFNFLLTFLSTYFLEVILTLVGITIIYMRAFIGAVTQTVLTSVLYGLSGAVFAGHDGFILTYFIAMAICIFFTYTNDE